MEQIMQKVFKVYSGRANGCMCGCRGIYRVTNEDRAFADQERGYPYDDEHVSDRSVRMIGNKVLSNPNTVFENDYAYLEQGHRVWVAYFRNMEAA